MDGYKSQTAPAAPIYEEILAEIDRHPRERPFTIGINGIDGSGKTMFADALARLLLAQGRSVQVLHIDDFHNSKSVRYRGTDQGENYYYRSIDFERLTN